MGFIRITALLGLAIGHILASNSMMVCNEDNCLRAIQASAFTTEHGTADCSSYFLTTVTPVTTTITATATVCSLDATTADVTASSSLDITTIQTTVIETVIPLPVSPSTVATQISIPAKNLVDIVPRSLTVVPSSIPAYASACSGSVHYSSACSCIGVTNSITTLSPPSTTVTITITLATATTALTTAASTTTATTTNSTSVSVTTDACGTAGGITTVTVTAPAVTETIYAACASSKLIGSHDGLGISAAVPQYNYTSQPFTSAYDCCVSCLLDTTCGAASSSSAAGYCYLFHDGGNCTASRQVGLYYTDASLLPNEGYIVSQGLCGKLSFGGVE